jgi:hypothetical protein
MLGIEGGRRHMPVAGIRETIDHMARADRGARGFATAGSALRLGGEAYLAGK